MTLSRGCCCGSQCIRDCIVGTTIESGCCHHADTLILSCQRPGFSTNQHFVSAAVTIGDPDCEMNYSYTQLGMEPVQAIYKFEECRFVFRYAEGNQAVNLIELPKYNDIFMQGEACKNPCCHPEFDPDVCCYTTFPPIPPAPECLCKTWFGAGNGGLSNSRTHDLYKDLTTKWFIETTCHKWGLPLSEPPDPYQPRLYDQFLCLVFFERWWKIAENCPAGVRIKVPGCNVTPSGSDCSGVPFQTDDLVPKWWIFGCSGIPLYQCDLDDALSLGVIEPGEYVTLLDDIATKSQPSSQPTVEKLAKAGYLGAKDWRPQQRQAFIDLHDRFPNAGYNLCIEDLEDMEELSPFRKRFCDPVVGVVTRPYLHKDDVYPDNLSVPPPPHNRQAKCMKNYPGDPTNQDDYNFWRERQWVYFQGIPGGWQWAGWNAASGTGLSELDAIAAGYGRNGGIGGPQILASPMLAFRGEPRPNPVCSSASSSICPNTQFCNACIGTCSNCGQAPIAACDPPEVCRKFSIYPECEGVHFLYSQYYARNDIQLVNGVCESDVTYICAYQVHSFLTEAKRSRDSWDEEIPFTCRTENPPLPMYNDWPEISRGHYPPQAMCNEILNPADPQNPKYDLGDLCCTGECEVYSTCYYGGTQYGCPELGPHRPCGARTDCPATEFTPEQIACIGHPVTCQEPPPP